MEFLKMFLRLMQQINSGTIFCVLSIKRRDRLNNETSFQLFLNSPQFYSEEQYKSWWWVVIILDNSS